MRILACQVQVVDAIGKPPSGSCFAEESLLNTVVFSIRGMSSLSITGSTS